MRFPAILQLVRPNGSALTPGDFPDPRSNPGDVPASFLYNIPPVAGGTAQNGVWAIALESNTPADNVVVDIYVADESQFPARSTPNIGDLDRAALRWYLDSSLTGVALTAGAITTLAGPPSGLFYIRPTTIVIGAPQAGASQVKATSYHG